MSQKWSRKQQKCVFDSFLCDCYNNVKIVQISYGKMWFKWLNYAD